MLKVNQNSKKVVISDTEYRSFIPDVAKELDINEEQLYDFVNVYWKVIKKNVESLDNNHVVIEGLGTFKSTLSAITRYEKFIGNKLRPKTFPEDRAKFLGYLTKLKKLRERESFNRDAKYTANQSKKTQTNFTRSVLLDQEKESGDI